MKTGDTKYYKLKQLKNNGIVSGYLSLIGRQYGYIVQLHFFGKPGYRIDKVFQSYEKAERFFDDVLNGREKA